MVSRRGRAARAAARRPAAASLSRIAYHVPTAVAGFDEPHVVEPGERLPQRGPVDAELLGELSLRREGRSRREDTVEDGLDDRRGDLFVDPLPDRWTQKG